MIHAIHAGAAAEDGFREKGIVIYGFGGSANDFSDVRMPAGLNNLRNCSGCHTGTTFAVSELLTTLQPTTVNTATNIASPDDDRNITPTASVCASCHDALGAKTHMTEEGGQFDYVAFVPETPPSGGGDPRRLCAGRAPSAPSRLGIPPGLIAAVVTASSREDHLA